MRVILPMRLRIRFGKISLTPIPKMAVSIPQMMSPELNRIADVPLTPKSLKAFFIQLNHGAYRMASEIDARAITGPIMPHSPAILVNCPFCFEPNK
jgi:hypothetical protein